MGQVVRHHLFGHFSRHPKSAALQLLPAYAAGLEDAAAVDAATIPVERIAGPLLLIAGGDDAMWPSVTMARAMAARRRDAGVDAGDEVVVFDHAGHFLRPPVTATTVPWNDSMVSGGEPAATAVAQAEAWTRILGFLWPR